MYKLAIETWDKDEIKAINKVIDSGIFSMSSNVFAFEKNAANYFDSRFCVMVNSGSSANLLMIASLFFKKDNPLKKGDEIIVPAVSWSTTYAPLQQYGLKLRFVDVDQKTLNFDLSQLEDAVTDKTKGIFAVNLLGNPNEFSKIKKICVKHNLFLIEDNCESMGAKYGDKYCGTFGIMGSFSCFFSHHISTMEGGFILTDDEELHHIMLSLRAHGWTRNLPKNNLVTGTKSNNDFEESFNFVLPGYNLRPLEMSGAIGIEQLKKLEDFVLVRRKNKEAFDDLISTYNQLVTQKEIGYSSWFGFSILISEECKFTRKEILDVFAKNNIETRPIVSGNILNKQMMKYFDYTTYGDMETSEYVDKYGFFIGNSHKNLSREFEYLTSALKEIFK